MTTTPEVSLAVAEASVQPSIATKPTTDATDDSASELSIEDQQAAADRAIDGLAAQADVWADEIDLVVIVKNLGAAIRGLSDRMPKDVREGFINRQEAQIDALARQAYLEGFYRGGESRKAYDAIETAKIVEDNEQLNATFDLQWAADMRAIKLWQAAHPGKERTWPDRCCMVTWLMERYETQLIAPADAETDASNRSESTPPAVLAAPTNESPAPQATKKTYIKPLRTIVEIDERYADQIRDLLNNPAPHPPVEGLREALKEAIDVFEGMNDDEINEELLPRLKAALFDFTPAHLPTGREHDLKTWPEFFEEVIAGRKTFEVRHNDRDYKVGDILWLREWSVTTGEYSGRETRRLVTYVMSGRYGVEKDTIIMALASPSLTAEVEPEELEEFIADRSANRAADILLKNFTITRRSAPATLIEQSGAALDLQGPGKMDSEDRSTHEA